MDSVSFSANVCSFHSPCVSDIDRKLSSELKTMSRYYSLKINLFPSFHRNAIISRIIILFQAPQSKSFDTNYKYSHNGSFFFLLYRSLFTCPFLFVIFFFFDLWFFFTAFINFKFTLCKIIFPFLKINFH